MSGTIEAGTLLRAYRAGLFPMVEMLEDATELVRWYSPDPRGVIPLDRFHIPRSLKRSLRKSGHEIRLNSDFPAVITACADRAETWISPGLLASYVCLHEMGWAHSVECWDGGELAGGLYGVAIGAAFFGESMFSKRTGASKAALVHLVSHLRERGFFLLDTQWSNPHLEQFGCIEIPRGQYLQELEIALQVAAQF